MNLDFEIINDIGILLEKRILLYGYGDCGKILYELLDEMGKRPEHVCVTNQEDAVKLLKDVKAIPVRKVKESFDCPDVLIILGSYDYFEEMEGALERVEINLAGYCSIYAFYISLFMHYKRLNKDIAKKIEFDLCANEKRYEYSKKAYLWGEAFKATQRTNPILIYQPGKVGSRSIWHHISDRSVHFHSLVMPYGFRELGREIVDYNIQLLKEKKRVKIITAVREPIARDLSAVFQDSDYARWPFCTINGHIFWWYGDYKNDPEGVMGNFSAREKEIRWEISLNDTYRRLMHSIMKYKVDEFSWFNYELKSVFDIDIYEYPFDREAGFTVIKKDNIEILAVKLEKLNSLETVIADFLEDENYRLADVNTGREKIYHYAYEGLKRTLTIPKDYVDYYYDGNPYMDHFYSEEEKQGFLWRWKEYLDI